MSLNELIYKQKYDAQDFVLFLRQLLPKGPVWRIPLPDEYPIEITSILSEENFGRITVTSGNTVITPNGIESLEDFGIPEKFNFGLTVNSVISDEIFGLCILNLSLTLTSINSEESFGSPSIVVA